MGQEAGNYSVLKAPGAALHRPKHVHKRRGSAHRYSCPPCLEQAVQLGRRRYGGASNWTSSQKVHAIGSSKGFLH